MGYRYTRYLATEPDADGDSPLSIVRGGNLTRSGVSTGDQALLLRLLTCTMGDPVLLAVKKRPPNRHSKGLLNLGSTAA